MDNTEMDWYATRGLLKPNARKVDNTEILKQVRSKLARKLWYFRTGAVMSSDDHPSEELLSQANQILSIKLDDRYALKVVDTKAEMGFARVDIPTKPEVGRYYDGYLDAIKDFKEEGWEKVIE